MFEAGLDFAAFPDLRVVADRSYAVLDRAATRISEQLPPDRRPPPSLFSAHIRALCHGIVELFTRGPGIRSQWSAEELLEAGVGIYLRGLGLLPPDR